MAKRYFIVTTLGLHKDYSEQDQLWLDTDHYPEVEEAGGPKVLDKLLRIGEEDSDDTVVYIQEVVGGIEGWQKYCREKRSGLKKKFGGRFGQRININFRIISQLASDGIDLSL